MSDGLKIEVQNHHWRDYLECWVERWPPFDCILGICDVPDCPGGDLGGNSHGRGSAKYRWVIRGEGLAVQWVYYSDEHLPATMEVLDNMGHRCLMPLAVDLGYHSAIPLYEQQYRTPCDLLGIDCFYDGSGLNAEPGLKLLNEKGEDAVWDWLEKYWTQMMSTVIETNNERSMK